MNQLPYEMPSDLEAAIVAFVSYYNYRRYHKALDVAGKPSVQHLVGFIQHEEPHGAQIEGRLPQMVQRPAQRADDDLRHGLPYRSTLPGLPTVVSYG